jgi:hypothetical protein
VSYVVWCGVVWCGVNEAVWQNQMHVAEYLCNTPKIRACPLQVNAFACSLVHWLATATAEVGGEGGVLLLPMAEWVGEDISVVFQQQLRDLVFLSIYYCVSAFGKRMRFLRYSKIRTYCSP